MRPLPEEAAILLRTVQVHRLTEHEPRARVQALLAEYPYLGGEAATQAACASKVRGKASTPHADARTTMMSWPDMRPLI